jgi:hypothetical protein
VNEGGHRTQAYATFLMRKTSLKIFIVALLLGLCSYIFFRLAALKTLKDSMIMEDDFYLSEGSAPLTYWDYAAVISLLGACSLTLTALIMWKRNRDHDELGKSSIFPKL